MGRILKNGQMNLPFGWDGKSLEERLRALTGRPLSLAVTENSISVLSVRRSGGKTSLRLHSIFLRAGTEVVSEIARFLESRKKGERFPVLSRFIRENMGLIEKADKRAARPQPKPKAAGRFHDLASAYDSINRQYFGGRVLCDIGWGRRSGARGYAVKRRTLGSYRPPEKGGTGLISINPILDRRRVPSYYVRFVVYHEMLHAHLGVSVENGRRRLHTPEFRRRERLFVEYRRAMEWERREKLGA